MALPDRWESFRFWVTVLGVGPRGGWFMFVHECRQRGHGAFFENTRQNAAQINQTRTG